MARVLRSYREVIGLASRGEFSRHLDAQLAVLVQALEDSPADKCKGEITVKLTFDFELGRVDVRPEVKVKLPDTTKFVKTPFWTVDGQLSVEHPNQQDMFSGRTINGGATGTDD